MSIFRRSRSLDQAERSALCYIVSVLLDYPTPDLAARYPDLIRRAQQLPVTNATSGVITFVTWWSGLAAEEREQQYVATFDFRRRTPLHLTHLTHGDTRERGVALLQLKHVLTRHGYEIGSGELPDYLPLLLEFAADNPRGLRLLGSQRRPLELLRRSLEDLRDPFAPLLSAVLAVLPRLDQTDLHAVAALAAQGPPTDKIGSDTYEIPSASAAGARR